jgi:nucleoside-diphosphate-sugar epimerase
MNLLITGIHGFVGSNLTKVLRKQYTIYGLDIVAPETEGVVRTFSWADLEHGVLPEVDIVIHLAGKAHDTKSQAEAQVYFDINTGLTRKIYDYFLVSKAKKFIFFSSVKAVADAVSGDMLTEEVIPAPKGPYGESKIMGENYIRDHWSASDSGKLVYILRPCMIHGPGNKGNLNLLYQLVQTGIPWPLGAFENCRSFTSIANLCFVIDRLISDQIPFGTYNMGDDEALSTNELIGLMCEMLNRKARIWNVPKGLMTGFARLGGMMHLPLNPERLRKLTGNYVVSNAKIKKALGIDRMPVSAEEGLKETISWMMKEKLRG